MNDDGEYGIGSSESYILVENTGSRLQEFSSDISSNLDINIGDFLDIHEFHDITSEIQDLRIYDFMKDNLLPNGINFRFYDDVDRFYERSINKGRLKMGEHSYIAPHSIVRLFKNKKRGLFYKNMVVEIGKGSNIQEVRSTVCNFPNQKIFVKVGDNSSIAHGVRFVINRPTDQAVFFNIGDNVFVGISSVFENGVVVKSGGPGRYTSIGFGCHLKKGSIIGSRSIIGDGAQIGEGVEIPDDVIVLPGMHIDTVASMNMIDVIEYLYMSDDQRSSFIGLIKISSVKDREYIYELGAVFKFLETFNDEVLEANHKFPVMYSLIKAYHKDMYNTLKYGDGTLVNVNLPKDLDGFMLHYYNESVKKSKDPGYQIIIYTGDFTTIEIDPSIKVKGLLYNYGDTKIKSDVIIDGVVVNRCGDEGGSVSIENSLLHSGVVFHGGGHKSLKDSQLGEWSIIHGPTSLEKVNVQDETIIHDSMIYGTSLDDRMVIGSRNTIVGATIVDSFTGNNVNISGHEKHEDKKSVMIGGSHIGTGSKIGEGTTIQDSIISGGTQFIRHMSIVNQEF